MKTLTFNKRHVLFGMMVLSLGMTKSWLQTADARGTLSYASNANEAEGSAAPTPAQRPSTASKSFTYEFEKNIEGCESKKNVVTPSSKTTEPDLKFDAASGEFKPVTGTGLKPIATYSFFCKSLNETLTGEVDLDAHKTVKTALDEADDKIQADISARIKEVKEAKLLAENIKNCVVYKDGDEIVDLEDNNKYFGKKLSCLARKVRDENSDRKERRAAFREQVVEEIQAALLASDTDAERREILAALKNMKSEVGFDAALAQEIKWLEKGAKALASAKKNENILALGRDSALNPNNEYNNDNIIDRIAWEFNIKTNTSLQRYSEETKTTISDWSDLIVPIAIQAQTKQDELVREYFTDTELPVKDGINNNIGDNRNKGGNQNGQPNNGRNNNDTGSTGNVCSDRTGRCDVDLNSMPAVSRQQVAPRTSMNNQRAPMTSVYGNRRSTNGGIPSNYNTGFVPNGQQFNPNMNMRGNYQMNGGQYYNPMMPFSQRPQQGYMMPGQQYRQGQTGNYRIPPTGRRG